MYAIFNFFASLRLTVVTLVMALILVFIGTLAQVKMGLFLAQEKYFSSMFVYWGPENGSWRIPVWPGGYLLGAILLLNLVAAHIKRFEFSKKKFGIFIVHAGLILMFLGQFATQLFQIETQMPIPEGGSLNYSESIRFSELAVIDVTDPKNDKVVAIPERALARHKEIKHPDLPFVIKVKNYRLNSQPKLTPKGEIEFDTLPQAVKMNERNIPSATIELAGNGAPAGEWTLSNWLAEDRLLGVIQKELGSKTPASLGKPKSFSVNGRNYVLLMRPQRFYKPFHLALKEFRFDRYLGTDIPKNFSSRIQIERPDTGENREVLIYMNNPLRYWGETYYQGGYFPDETGTILQVVRNPSWLTPYVACVMVGAGLLVQFLGHLVGFARKRRTAIA